MMKSRKKNKKNPMSLMMKANKTKPKETLTQVQVNNRFDFFN